MKETKESEQRSKVGRIIISMVRDSIILSIIYLTDRLDIWSRIQSMCNVKSSSRRMSLKEKFYSLHLLEGKGIGEHLHEVNLIVIELVGLGIVILNEDLIDQTLNSLPKSWSIFK